MSDRTGPPRRLTAGARSTSQNHPIAAHLFASSQVKGDSGLAGTYTVAYEGSYSADIAYEATASDVKDALEDLDTIDEVDVEKEVLGSSIKYTVTFTKQRAPAPVAAVAAPRLARLELHGRSKEARAPRPAAQIFGCRAPASPQPVPDRGRLPLARTRV